MAVSIPGLLFVILMGAVLFLVGSYPIYSDYSALTAWDAVNGTVSYSDLVIRVSADSGPLYVPSIDYRYSVEGKEYHGWCCQTPTSDGPAAQKIVAAIPKGGTVELFVNPANAAESRIRSQVVPFSAFSVLMSAFGALIAIGGLYNLVASREA